MTARHQNYNTQLRRDYRTTIRSLYGEASGRFNNKLMSNALTSSFKYANQELRDEFYSILNSTGQTISGVVNQLIQQWLAEQGIEVPIEASAPRYGRPLGARNVVVHSRRSNTTVASSGNQPQNVVVPMATPTMSIDEPRLRRTAVKSLQQPVPTHEEIQLTILESNAGLYPVGNPRRLTDEDKRILRKEAAMGRAPKGLYEATYVDEVGNYFNEDWWWWWRSYFAGNIGSNHSQLVIWAIERGAWFPTDPNDYRIDKWLREKLFDEAGNRKENVILEKSGVQLEQFEQFEQSDAENRPIF